jgi:hypothetical protein
MRLQMRSEVGAVGESTMAVVAAERLLARMRSNVSLKKPWPRESFAAEMAFAGQRVRSDVHLQSSSRRVDLAAFVACHGFLDLIALVSSTMELLML